jgi:carboxylesterase type B
VTVAGQSAGGAATMLLTTLPRAEGLFRAAIPMSGSVFPSRPIESTQRLTARMAEHLGIAATFEEFARVSPAALVDAQTAATTRPEGAALGGELNFFPFVDGGVVPDSPMHAVAAGRGSALPLLIGTTEEEFNAAARMAPADDEEVGKTLSALGLDDAGIAAYRANAQVQGDQIGQAVTDRMFRVPALRVAEARSVGPAPTYHYEFQWRTPALGGLGAVHCLDLPFVFDVLDDPHATVVAGDVVPQELADRMHANWVAFVTDNDPGWAPFRNDSRRTMVFDEQSKVVDDLHAPIRSLWP